MSDLKPLGAVSIAEQMAAREQMEALVAFVKMITRGDDALAVATLTGALIVVASHSKTPTIEGEILGIAHASLQSARAICATRHLRDAAATCRRSEPS